MNIKAVDDSFHVCYGMENWTAVRNVVDVQVRALAFSMCLDVKAVTFFFALGVLQSTIPGTIIMYSLYCTYTDFYTIVNLALTIWLFFFSCFVMWSEMLFSGLKLHTKLLLESIFEGWLRNGRADMTFWASRHFKLRISTIKANRREYFVTSFFFFRHFY